MTRIGLVCALISVFATSACGGDEEAASAIGLWGIERADGCVVLFRVAADDQCRLGVACRFQSGEYGLERSEGPCALADGMIEATWKRSTCADPANIRGRFEVSETTLVLEGSDGRLIFERVEGDGEPGNGIVHYGCWEGGTFEPSELQAL